MASGSNEYFRGAKAGFTHCCNNICKGRKDRRGVNSFDSHVFGSVAEYAFALAIGGVWWGEREGHFNKADVSPKWQVRWANSPQYGLVQKHEDNRDWSGVLCSGRSNVITIHGWMPFDEVNESNYNHFTATLFPFVEWDGLLIPEQNKVHPIPFVEI